MLCSSVVQNENMKFDDGNGENLPDSENESSKLQIDESIDCPPIKATSSHDNYDPPYGQYQLELTDSWDDISDQNNKFTQNRDTDEESEPQTLKSKRQRLSTADRDTPFCGNLNQPPSYALFQRLDKTAIKEEVSIAINHLKNLDEYALYMLLYI